VSNADSVELVLFIAQVIRIFYLVYSSNSQTVESLPLLDGWTPEAQLEYSYFVNFVVVC